MMIRDNSVVTPSAIFRNKAEQQKSLYCIVLNCIVLYCFVLFCIVVCCIVLYCFVLYCIALYCSRNNLIG